LSTTCVGSTPHTEEGGEIARSDSCQRSSMNSCCEARQGALRRESQGWTTVKSSQLRCNEIEIVRTRCLVPSTLTRGLTRQQSKGFRGRALTMAPKLVTVASPCSPRPQRFSWRPCRRLGRQWLSTTTVRAERPHRRAVDGDRARYWIDIEPNPRSTDEFRRLGGSTRTYAIEPPTGDPP
jgi:hypothetical protein